MGSFIEDNFFIIDSESLETVESHLYGFSMVGDIVVNNSNYHGEKLGWGAYINVKRADSQIVIEQDTMGSQGIYLFRSGEYFAISNSFIKLVDYLKSDYSLTVNERYADAFLASGLCIYSYDETLINEITVIDRNAEITIDIAKHSLGIEIQDNKENTVSIGSEEGVKLLDSWYKRWTTIIYSLISRNERTVVDLSGGFDTRMTFTLFLHPEIDLSKVTIKSDNDKRYTHAEDYAIASQIRDKFGFELNKQHESGGNDLYNSMDDTLDIIFNNQFGFHNGIAIREKTAERGEYHFSGNGGGTARNADKLLEDDYIAEKSRARSVVFPGNVRQRFSDAISEVMRRSYDKTREKLGKIKGEGGVPDSQISRHMYRETRNRVHFGKTIWDAYLGREFRVSPLLDPDFQRIALVTDECMDDDLLMAVIYTRYGRGIIDFPVQGGRSIKKETIEFAKKINEKYPFSYAKIAGAVGETEEKAYPEMPVDNNPVLTKKYVEDRIEDIFYSKEIRKFICDHYGKGTYKYICYTINNKKSNRLSHAYASLAIYAVYQAAQKNGNARANTRVLLEALNPIPEAKRYRPKNNWYRRAVRKVVRKMKRIYGRVESK